MTKPNETQPEAPAAEDLDETSLDLVVGGTTSDTTSARKQERDEKIA